MSLITMSRLGQGVQFGNQLIQYAFLRSYAERWGIGYQCPKWVGQTLFGFDDQPITEQLPPYQERLWIPDWLDPGNPPRGRMAACIPQPPQDDAIGHDYRGYCQFHTSWYRPLREFILWLFHKQQRVEELIEAMSPWSLRIGIHIRRGDFGRGIYHLTPISWYLKWLREFGLPMQTVLYVASEDPSVAKWFERYDPVTMELLGIKVEPQTGYIDPQKYSPADRTRSLAFWPDWLALSMCDIILGSASTFSFTAAWLSNNQNISYWRPVLSAQCFERVDPWNCHIATRENLDDYPGIPGTSLTENPDYWGKFKPKYPGVEESEEEIRKWM